VRTDSSARASCGWTAPTRVAPLLHWVSVERLCARALKHATLPTWLSCCCCCSGSSRTNTGLGLDRLGRGSGGLRCRFRRPPTLARGWWGDRSGGIVSRRCWGGHRCGGQFRSGWLRVGLGAAALGRHIATCATSSLRGKDGMQRQTCGTTLTVSSFFLFFSLTRRARNRGCWFCLKKKPPPQDEKTWLENTFLHNTSRSEKAKAQAGKTEGEHAPESSSRAEERRERRLILSSPHQPKARFCVSEFA
jgi:hypothetical protein